MSNFVKFCVLIKKSTSKHARAIHLMSLSCLPKYNKQYYNDDSSDICNPPPNIAFVFDEIESIYHCNDVCYTLANHLECSYCTGTYIYQSQYLCNEQCNGNYDYTDERQHIHKLLHNLSFIYSTYSIFILITFCNYFFCFSKFISTSLK